MEYVKGQLVEICSKEEGFLGSYFRAKILSKIPDENLYAVKYKDLLTEDQSKRLIEVISADEIRPLPPKFPTQDVRIDDVVDAFDRDGWWVGEIIARRGDLYTVHFETTNETLDYPIERLRKHLEWYEGAWVYLVH